MIPDDVVVRPPLHKALEANQGGLKRRDLMAAAVSDIVDPNVAEVKEIGIYLCRLQPKAPAQRNDMVSTSSGSMSRTICSAG